MAMTEETARNLGFTDLAAHDEAHRLVTLRQDDPGASSRDGRRHLKELLFYCHYSASTTCTYYADHR